MRKITARQYAQALYEATTDASDKEISKITEAFVHQVYKNKHSGLLKKISKLYEEYRDKREGIVAATATVSAPLSEKQKHELEAEIKKKFSAKHVRIQETIDPTILGGIKLKVGDTIYDWTLKNRLESLRTALT